MKPVLDRGNVEMTARETTLLSGQGSANVNTIGETKC